MVNLINEPGMVFGAIGGYPTNPDEIHRYLLRECCLIHPSMIFRKDTIEAAGGYSADAGQTHIIHFPKNIDTTAKLLLISAETASVYTGDWFNPRSGEFTHVAARLEQDRRFITLPDRPTSDDWVLVVRKNDILQHSKSHR